jgi:hypothetical protein
MKCSDCIYYTQNSLENECLAFYYYCYPVLNDCDGVDENFNVVKDDMGNNKFTSKEKMFELIKKVNNIDLGG